MKLFTGQAFRWTIFFLVLTVVGSGTYVFFTWEDVKSAVPKEATPSHLPVSFIEVYPDRYSAAITVYGQAAPEWQTPLRSPVSGKVVYISERLKAGMTVEKDQILVKVDDTTYKSKLADAELTLANARLNLLKEEREAAQALENWKQSGLQGLPKSDLVLRKPQFLAAKKQLEAAFAALWAAKEQLNDCTIRSPYKGLIHERSISIGSLLSHGETIAEIQGTQKAEIEIALDAEQWSMLGTDYKSIGVSLTDESGNYSWKAAVTRADQRILPKSRLRRLFCEVDNPLAKNPPLLSGTFLTITLTGKKIANLLKLPESTVTKKGMVWYKTKEDRLKSFTAQPVFYRRGSVFIRPPETVTVPIHVALYPNNAFVNGRAVLPKKTEKNSTAWNKG